MKYLFYLLETGKSYSTINSHKAMLLQTLPFFGNTWCNDCKLIARFMKGIMSTVPSKPKYVCTWDVSCVLEYLATLWPLNRLTLKQLTFRTVALLALATAPRAQTIVSMNIDNMIRENQCLSFFFPHVLKTTRSGHAYVLKIDHYADEKLCPMHTLLYYLDRTKPLRKSQQVFISYVTHASVTTCTIARWLKYVLSASGIDISVFQAHSFRSASTSAALAKGCSLKLILDTADWSSDKNFRKFYYRSTVSNKDMSFVKAVMGSSD